MIVFDWTSDGSVLLVPSLCLSRFSCFCDDALMELGTLSVSCTVSKVKFVHSKRISLSPR